MLSGLLFLPGTSCSGQDLGRFQFDDQCPLHHKFDRSLRLDCSRGRVAYLGDMQFSATLLKLVSKPMTRFNKSLMGSTDPFDSAQFVDAASQAKNPRCPGLFSILGSLLCQVGEYPIHPCLDSSPL